MAGSPLEGAEIDPLSRKGGENFLLDLARFHWKVFPPFGPSILRREFPFFVSEEHLKRKMVE